MKKIFLAAALAVSALSLQAQQQEKTKLYDTAADSRTDIKNALTRAASEHKNVLLQIGGNWCIWCTRFHHTVAGNDTLQGLLDQNYITVYVNYEPKKNAGARLWSELGYPQRFGFPVFVVLDPEGRRLHTQSSAYLEEGKGHSPEKIAEFFRQWSPDAVAGKTLRR